MSTRNAWLSCCLSVVILLLLPGAVAFGQTGKIAGQVTDAETNEPLPGVNVILEGTEQGAATDANGEYYIINVTPGTYSLSASMVGYQQIVINSLGNMKDPELVTGVFGHGVNDMGGTGRIVTADVKEITHIVFTKYFKYAIAIFLVRLHAG